MQSAVILLSFILIYFSKGLEFAMDYLAACLLGLIEGVTEYLPVSSSGHLIIAEQMLQVKGKSAEIFTVLIQPGAILAVVALYWQRFWGLVFPAGKKGFYGWHGIWLLCLTTLPACAAGLLLHAAGFSPLSSPHTVPIALLAGSICMIITEKYKKKPDIYSLDDLDWAHALCIGLFQCAALWPGFSRSAATIMGGLILGLNRRLAVTYSFIAAVPVMFAASGYEAIRYHSFFTADNTLFFLAGAGCAFACSLLVIKLFIALLAKITLLPFAIYRVFLAAAFYLLIIRN